MFQSNRVKIGIFVNILTSHSSSKLVIDYKLEQEKSMIYKVFISLKDKKL